MLRKALLVARWEFVTTVTRRAYIFAVVAMPVFYGGMYVLAGLAGQSALTRSSRVPTGIVDQTHLVDVTLATKLEAQRSRSRPDLLEVLPRSGGAASSTPVALPVSAALIPYDTLESALAALQARQIGLVVVLDADYLRTGTVTTYARDSGFFAQQVHRQRQVQVADAIRASLIGAALSNETLSRAYAPVASVKRWRVDPGGHREAVTDMSALGPFAGPMGVFILFTMAIFFSAGFLQQATVADRQNRMIEILLSSVNSDELLIGKLMGLGGAGLLQVAIYVALVIVPGSTLLAIFEVPLTTLALSTVYFVIGYLLFGCLMAGTGMIARTGQEAAQLSALWTLVSASPVFFIASIGTAPNGTLARALSFMPLTSPVTMMLRLASGEVPITDIVISIVIGCVAISGALRSASKIFRVSALMFGQRPTLPEFARWMRAT